MSNRKIYESINFTGIGKCTVIFRKSNVVKVVV